MNLSASEVALTFVARRMRTEYETREYLKKKGYSDEEISTAIDYLYRYVYLNDRKYAELFVREKSRYTPSGRFKLYQMMRQKGLDKSLIEEVLAEEFSIEYETQLALQLLEKPSNIKRDKFQKMRYLQGRGFSGESIKGSISAFVEDGIT